MEEREKKAQEIYMEYQMLEQHIQQRQKQLEMVTHQILELNTTTSSLDEYNKIKNGSSVFVPLSSGIFAKANIAETSELLVNVGANIAVKKDIPSIKKLIQNQIEELIKIQKQMVNDLEKITNNAAQVEMKLRGLVSEN